MSEANTIMKLEFLPNEILIECFEYLNAPHIFYSFYRLNFRFNQLIRTIRLHLNCENLQKPAFNQFCTDISSNCELKQKIRSIHLSNKNTCALINMFLSLFSLAEFPHLRSLTLTGMNKSNIERLKTMIPLISQLTYFRLFHCQESTTDLLSILPLSNLRTLVTPTMDSILAPTRQLLSMKRLTISQCSMNNLSRIIQCIPMLKYLTVQYVYKRVDSPYENQSCLAIHLKQFTVERFHENFDVMRVLLKRMPNLKCLTVSNGGNDNLINAYQWEDLITSSLSQLIRFKFKFTNESKSDLLKKFKEFQSDFWLEKHHWYTEYISYGYSTCIYTIPYISNSFTLTSKTSRCTNASTNLKLKTFTNVSNLILYQEMIVIHNSFYFPSVTHLTLENNLYLDDVDNYLFTIEHLNRLKNIVNLSNIQHLTISSSCDIGSSSILLELLEQTSQLSSLSIELQHLTKFFHDKKLCQHLNKLIRKLDVCKASGKSFGNLEQLKKFCKIFSNVEQLSFHIKQNDSALLLLANLPRISYMEIDLSYGVNPAKFLPWFGTEAQKLNLMIYYEVINVHSNMVHIWIDRKDIFHT